MKICHPERGTDEAIAKGRSDSESSKRRIQTTILQKDITQQ
ncbi:MAG TPA: hypothetical protein PLN22_12800 [Ignavibacteria bacterium]|nr:hypothetical protein [Ignavibacteria bacterium]